MNVRAGRIRFIAGVAILTVSILLTPLSSVAHESEEHQSAEGQITRDQLRIGLRDYVSDEALELANSAALADERAAWHDDDSFVDQIDYQLTFRQQVDFMSSEPAHIEDVLENRRESPLVMSMGLYMTEDEEAEMLIRDRRGDAFDAIVESISGVNEAEFPEGLPPQYGSVFAGITMDQLNGGQVILALTSRDGIDDNAIGGLLDDPSKLTILIQKYSFDKTNAFRDLLVEDLKAAGIEHDVAIIWTDIGRTIEVRTPDPSTASNVLGADVPGDSYTVVEGSGIQDAGAPGTTHSLSDQQPGLRIEDVQNGPNVGACTWGFNGHTSNLNYLLTAGHCLGDDNNFPGNYAGSSVDIWQNSQSTRDLTNNPYVYSRDTSTWDVARISSTYADDNCYHGNNSLSSPPPHCGWPIAHRAIHNSWEVDVDRTCASLGASNTYRCGYIREENANGGNRVRVDMVVIGGDSGSGMKWDYRADGILTDRSTTQAFFQTAYHVQYALGNGYFYLNCHSPGKKVNTNPSNWAACPAVNA